MKTESQIKTKIKKLESENKIYQSVIDKYLIDKDNLSKYNRHLLMQTIDLQRENIVEIEHLKWVIK